MFAPQISIRGVWCGFTTSRLLFIAEAVRKQFQKDKWTIYAWRQLYNFRIDTV